MEMDFIWNCIGQEACFLTIALSLPSPNKGQRSYCRASDEIIASAFTYLSLSLSHQDLSPVIQCDSGIWYAGREYLSSIVTDTFFSSDMSRVGISAFIFPQMANETESFVVNKGVEICLC